MPKPCNGCVNCPVCPVLIDWGDGNGFVPGEQVGNTTLFTNPGGGVGTPTTILTQDGVAYPVVGSDVIVGVNNPDGTTAAFNPATGVWTLPLTSLVFDAGTSTLTFVDENGTPNVIPIGAPDSVGLFSDLGIAGCADPSVAFPTGPTVDGQDTFYDNVCVDGPVTWYWVDSDGDGEGDQWLSQSASFNLCDEVTALPATGDAPNDGNATGETLLGVDENGDCVLFTPSVDLTCVCVQDSVGNRFTSWFDPVNQTVVALTSQDSSVPAPVGATVLCEDDTAAVEIPPSCVSAVDSAGNPFTVWVDSVTGAQVAVTSQDSTVAAPVGTLSIPEPSTTAGTTVDVQRVEFPYAEYQASPVVSPDLVFCPGTLDRLGWVVDVVSDGPETFDLLVNGAVVSSITLPAATVSVLTTISVPVATGDIVTVQPTSAAPATPSRGGNVLVRLVGDIC